MLQTSSFTLLCFTVIFKLTFGGENYQLNEKQNVMLHQTVKTLLGFRETPKDPQLLPNPNDANEVAPKYMLDLYERYRYGGTRRGKMRGNTVRCIQSDIALVNGEDMFVFNMSSVRPTERIFGAEVHVYKKKLKRKSNYKDLQIQIYEVAPEYLSEVGSLSMRPRSVGWHTYDVTNAATSCLATRRSQPHMLAVSFSANRLDGKRRQVKLHKFMRHHSRPFLVVFSNEQEQISLDHITPRINPQDFKYIQNTENNLPTESKRNERTTSDDSHSITKRQKRSIFDNEIPEHPIVETAAEEKLASIAITHPSMLQGREKLRHKITENKKILPHPEWYLAERRRRKHKSKRYKKKHNGRKRRLKFPSKWREWDSSKDEMNKNKISVNTNSHLCGRKKLVVNFADIGWSQWIISPKSFEAHYCAGECPFPMSKSMKPTNHATIQSIVHAIGIQSHVPAPCCVPDKMSSATLLYFDENHNVVLKNYPGMTVDTCACR